MRWNVCKELSAKSPTGVIWDTLQNTAFQIFPVISPDTGRTFVGVQGPESDKPVQQVRQGQFSALGEDGSDRPSVRPYLYWAHHHTIQYNTQSASKRTRHHHWHPKEHVVITHYRAHHHETTQNTPSYLWHSRYSFFILTTKNTDIIITYYRARHHPIEHIISMVPPHFSS